MDYNFVINPTNFEKFCIESREGLNTILGYINLLEIPEKQDIIDLIVQRINNLSISTKSELSLSTNSNLSLSTNSSLSLSNNSNSYINLEKETTKESNIEYINNSKYTRKGRFLILNEIEETIEEDALSSNYSSLSSDNYSLSSKESNNSFEDDIVETDLTDDVKEWGKAPKGFIRKGRFLVML